MECIIDVSQCIGYCGWIYIGIGYGICSEIEGFVGGGIVIGDCQVVYKDLGVFLYYVDMIDIDDWRGIDFDCDVVVGGFGVGELFGQVGYGVDYCVVDMQVEFFGVGVWGGYGQWCFVQGFDVGCIDELVIGSGVLFGGID